MDGQYTSFNVNDSVKVKLTDRGRQILAEYWGGKIPEWYIHYQDKDGWTQFQLHDLMHIFGQHVFNGCTAVPFETNILIDRGAI